MKIRLPRPTSLGSGTFLNDAGETCAVGHLMRHALGWSDEQLRAADNGGWGQEVADVLGVSATDLVDLIMRSDQAGEQRAEELDLFLRLCPNVEYGDAPS